MELNKMEKETIKKFCSLFFLKFGYTYDNFNKFKKHSPFLFRNVKNR